VVTSLDGRLPVLVGAAAVTQRETDPQRALDPVALMAQVVVAAVADAGPAALLDRIGWIAVPEGSWRSPDPGRLVAASLGGGGGAAHTVVAEVGVLQQEVITRACEVVATGRAEVALVVGGEARARSQAARRSGIDVPEPPEDGPPPDERWATADMGVADVEIERNIVNPVISYALIDRAIAARNGWSVAEHRDRLSQLWWAFARVAEANPDAWDRTAPKPEVIREPTGSNRMLAFPYTKLMASQWNVDQAAALLVCTVDTARALGVEPERWVFPWASAVCNHAVPVVQRDRLDESPGADAAAAALLAEVPDGASLDHVDLYSCFPAAVQVYARALGLSLDPPFDPPPTLTGGMTFGGGPLNNYVLQAMAVLVDRLRARPGSVGVSSSVSGFLTKQGFSLWSTAPPPSGRFAAADVTAAVAAADRPRPLDPGGAGAATVVASTVDRSGFEARLVAICELPDGRRTIAASTDADPIDALEAGDDVVPVDAAVEVTADGQLRL
jgi:acetyl-CoA C-acetyltransferase